MSRVETWAPYRPRRSRWRVAAGVVLSLALLFAAMSIGHWCLLGWIELLTGLAPYPDGPITLELPLLVGVAGLVLVVLGVLQSSQRVGGDGVRVWLGGLLTFVAFGWLVPMLVVQFAFGYRFVDEPVVGIWGAVAAALLTVIGLRLARAATGARRARGWHQP